MDYDAESLQFIRSYYIQARHLPYGIYPNIINLLYTILQFPLFGMPFICYLTIKYMHPKIFNFIEWYSMHLKKSYRFSQSPKVTNCILIISFVITNWITSILLITSHIFAIVEFIHYSNEVLNDAEKAFPYVYLGFVIISVICIIFLYAVMVYLVYLYNYFGIKPLSYIIPMLTSVNIIYFLSYFAPFMVLALIQVPLLILTFIMAYVAIIIIWCLLTYSFVTFVTPNASFKVKCQCKKCFIDPNYILLALIIMFLYALILMFSIVVHAFFLGSYTNSPSSEAIVIAILAGVVGSVVFKSAFKKIKEMTGSN